MIKFIILEDENFFRNEFVNIVDKLMIDSDIDYNVKSFSNCNPELERIIDNDNSSKIYILDIDLKTGPSGIDVAKKIRIKDWNSTIIMVTCHMELSYEALKAQIMLLDFISKYNEYETNLTKALKKALSKANEKKIIHFEANSITYRIIIDDILYITKDSIDRKCIIKTAYNELLVNKPLSDIMSELDNRFYQSHRGCLVNTERITQVNWKESTITFDTGEMIYLLSRDKKKGLKSRVFVD